MDFCSFVKNMGKTISKNICKNLIVKHSKKRLDHGKRSATDVLQNAS